MSDVYEEDLGFLRYAIERVCLAQGYSEEHAFYVAEAIGFAHVQGKLNQGLGVFEVLDIAFRLGLSDLTTTPEVIDEGPSWAVVDGKKSSGYFTLNVMAQKAIELAETSGIAIVFGGNHGDAGSFGQYVYKAFEKNMFAMSSNNSVPLAAPFGGMQNLLSCPPFDAIAPAGVEPPIWISTKFAEFYDADISEAAINQQPLKGKWIIDPKTGELSDDAMKYGVPVEGYGRVWDCTGAGQIQEPRTYAMNMWNESLCSIINPLGIPSTALPTVEEAVKPTNELPTVGGSYYMCINPAVFGSIDLAKARSDSYVSTIRNSKPRPGHSIRVPSEGGYKKIKEASRVIEILKNHRKPFFVHIAGRHGLSEEQLRADYEKTNQPA